MKLWFRSGGLEVASCDADEAGPLMDVFHQIVVERRWQADDLDDYLADSVFFLARRDISLIGGAKLVRGNPRDLPVNRVWPETALLGRPEIVDLALTALIRQHRGDLTALGALWATILSWCTSEGVTELWAEITPEYRRLYERFLKAPVHVMGELRMQWGEPTLPCRILISEQSALLAERARSSSVVRRIVAQIAAQAAFPPCDPGARMSSGNVLGLGGGGGEHRGDGQQTGR